jgi:hypothetical protein
MVDNLVTVMRRLSGNSGSLNLLESSWPLDPYRDSFTFTFYSKFQNMVGFYEL